MCFYKSLELESPSLSLDNLDSISLYHLEQQKDLACIYTLSYEQEILRAQQVELYHNLSFVENNKENKMLDQEASECVPRRRQRQRWQRRRRRQPRRRRRLGRSRSRPSSSS